MNSGQRVQQLRELYGWSQSQLADLAGVSQPTVARIERGDTVGAAYPLAVLSALNAPASLAERAIPHRMGRSTAWFRSHYSMRAWERHQAHRWGELAYELLLHLRRRVRIPPAAKVEIDTADPDEAAAQVRDRLRIRPDQPIKNLVRTVERAGVRVLPLPLEDVAHSAYSTLVGDASDEPVIFLFRASAADRVRYTVAHEIGHIALHHAGRPEDVRAAEREADTFAGAFLMPREPFLDDLRGMPATLSTFLRLKPRWGASIQAMIMRGAALGRISEWQQRNLFTQLSAKGWRTAEPIHLAPEEPGQFAKALTLVYGQQPAAREVARDLSLPTHVAAGLVGPAGSGTAPTADVVDLSERRRSRRRPSPGDALEA